jgi:hypothetical protein
MTSFSQGNIPGFDKSMCYFCRGKGVLAGQIRDSSVPLEEIPPVSPFRNM